MKKVFRLSMFGLALLAISFMSCNQGVGKNKDSETSIEDPKLDLVSLTIHSNEVDSSTWKGNIPNKETAITKDNIVAVFNYGSKTNQTIKEINVRYEGNFEVGVEKDVFLNIPASKGNYKEWNQKVQITRLSQGIKPILINGYYVDDKLIVDITKEYLIDKDSCTVKITVPKAYANVKIAGEDVSYVAGATPADNGSYSKEIKGITKGTLKPVVIKITDPNHTNSPLIKTLKIKHNDPSAYKPIEITRIDVGSEIYRPASKVEGKTFPLITGEELSLSVFFKTPCKGKERIRFVVGDGQGEKTAEVSVTGNRANHTFSSIKSGEHDVKIERLVQDVVKDTYSFKVKYGTKLEDIKVASLKIEDEGNNVGQTFKKTGGHGARGLGELKLADDAFLYEYIFSSGDKISVTIDVITEDVTLQYRLKGGNWTSISDKTKTDIAIPEGTHVVEIKITKAGFKDTIYKFKAGKKAIKIKSITIGSNTYNSWEEFAAKDTINVTEDKVTIIATWENTEVVTATLRKSGVKIAGAISGKTATWSNVPLEAGETELRLTFEMPETQWKNKVFKVKRPSSPESNTSLSEVKIFAYHRELLSPQRVEWPFAKDGMNEFDLYIKPESSEVKSVKMKLPSQATLQKITSGYYDGYYKANFPISIGGKIVFEVEAKDGSKKQYFIDREGKYKTGNPTSISQTTFLEKNYVYYSDSLPTKTSDKKVFDTNSFLAEVEFSENKIYLMFDLPHYNGMEDAEFSEGVTLVDLDKKAKFDNYSVSYDTSKMAVGESKNIEIHLKYKTSTNEVIDLFPKYAKYTVKVTKK
ncbi:MAG: hypothetical protein ACTTKH_06410 [Treponema sp.]